MPEGDDGSAESLPPGSCPICRKPAVMLYRPFCSRRCADVDLHNWFKGNYSIPVEEKSSHSEESDADESEESALHSDNVMPFPKRR